MKQKLKVVVVGVDSCVMLCRMSTAVCFYLGRLPCSVVTYSLLGSYLAQSLLGNYDPAEHGTGCDYLRHIQFAPSTCQNDELLETIAELHRSRRGLSSASAELEYLINASRLAMYGVDLHPVLVILLLLHYCCCLWLSCFSLTTSVVFESYYAFSAFTVFVGHQVEHADCNK